MHAEEDINGPVYFNSECEYHDNQKVYVRP